MILFILVGLPIAALVALVCLASYQKGYLQGRSDKADEAKDQLRERP